MKKLFLLFLPLFVLTGCVSDDFVSDLSVSFLEPTKWNGRLVPPRQSCGLDGGIGSTPPLFVSSIPEETNLLILEINDLDEPTLSDNGGHGSIGFYHDGSFSASLFPVPGESNVLPSFAFKEKSSRVDPTKPWPYMPPCIERKHLFYATVKAVKRTGSFDKQKTVLLGIGTIKLGRY